MSSKDAKDDIVVDKNRKNGIDVARSSFRVSKKV